jgi:hypothetical protein
MPGQAKIETFHTLRPDGLRDGARKVAGRGHLVLPRSERGWLFAAFSLTHSPALALAGALSYSLGVGCRGLRVGVCAREAGTCSGTGILAVELGRSPPSTATPDAVGFK